MPRLSPSLSIGLELRSHPPTQPPRNPHCTLAPIFFFFITHKPRVEWYTKSMSLEYEPASEPLTPLPRPQVKSIKVWQTPQTGDELKEEMNCKAATTSATTCEVILPSPPPPPLHPYTTTTTPCIPSLYHPGPDTLHPRPSPTRPYTLLVLSASLSRSVCTLHPGTLKPQPSTLRRMDSCITQLKAQGPSRTCTESKEEEDLNPPC